MADAEFDTYRFVFVVYHRKQRLVLLGRRLEMVRRQRL